MTRCVVDCHAPVPKEESVLPLTPDDLEFHSAVNSFIKLAAFLSKVRGRLWGAGAVGVQVCDLGRRVSSADHF